MFLTVAAGGVGPSNPTLDPAHFETEVSDTREALVLGFVENMKPGSAGFVTVTRLNDDFTQVTPVISTCGDTMFTALFIAARPASQLHHQRQERQRARRRAGQRLQLHRQHQQRCCDESCRTGLCRPDTI